MPFEGNYRVRIAKKAKTDVAEITLHTGWRRYHRIEIGDELTVLGDNVLVVLPPGLSEAEEERVRKFVEGKDEHPETI